LPAVTRTVRISLAEALSEVLEPDDRAFAKPLDGLACIVLGNNTKDENRSEVIRQTEV
jgi:hypothetical protein